MTIKAEAVADREEQLSALVDGELDSARLSAWCAAWRDDAETRACWHRYQLIGDVLRSEDLASTADHDAAFLIALRAKIELEPVVLAPGGVAGHAPVVEQGSSAAPAEQLAGKMRRRGWGAPAAVAAGFVVVVAGALTVGRSPTRVDSSAIPMVVNAPEANSAQLGQPLAAVSLESGIVPRNADVADEPQTLVANGKLVRDARLDRYFAAHQQWSGGSVIGAHAAFLRQVATDAPKR